MYVGKGIREMHESQAIDGSTWKNSKQSRIDKENIPVMPIIPAKFLYSEERVIQLRFLEYLFRSTPFYTENPNYLLNGEVGPLKSVNMKPFIKGPGNNPLEVNRM